MPAQVFSLHGSGEAGLSSVKPAEKRALKYEKGLKRPSDENRPKKPMTTYFMWANENRERVKTELKTNVASEIMKHLGDEWRDLPKKEKTKYETEYKKKLEVWKKLTNCYKMTSECQEHGKALRDYKIRMTRKPFQKDENMPKRSLSAYMMWAGKQRPSIVKKNPDAKVTEIMGLIAKAWNELSDKEKAPWTKKSKAASEASQMVLIKYKMSEDHKKYLAEKKAYEQKMEAKRGRLEKMSLDSLESDDLDAPESKRKTSDPKKKKTSDPKKKKSDPKNKVKSKKKTSDPKKKKKGSDPMKKKKTDEPKKRKRSKSSDKKSTKPNKSSGKKAKKSTESKKGSKTKSKSKKQ